MPSIKREKTLYTMQGQLASQMTPSSSAMRLWRWVLSSNSSTLNGQIGFRHQVRMTGTNWHYITFDLGRRLCIHRAQSTQKQMSALTTGAH